MASTKFSDGKRAGTMPEATSIKKLKIMISSTRSDLDQYRSEAQKIIRKLASDTEETLHLVEVSMEKEAQSGNREFAVAVSKRWVDESDWLVLIVGWNYGTISDEPDAEGLGVTEWEYRHAIANGKKVYVFMAGEPGTPDQYRVSSEESQDLKDWRQSGDIGKKMSSFRGLLQHTSIGLFSNIQSFRDKLERTLRNAIGEITLGLTAGSPLGDLMITLTPSINACTRKVTSIAIFKQLHDHLHVLRQHVLRPLRDCVVPKWEELGELGRAGETTLAGCISRALDRLESIRKLSGSIDPGHTLLSHCVRGLLSEKRLLQFDFNTGHHTSLFDFKEAAENFAIMVQSAFSEADRSMTREEGELRECYQVLLERLGVSSQYRNLSLPDQQRINAELSRIHVNRQTVRITLDSHHQWQEAHDELELLDGYRDTDVFERTLRGRQARLERLAELVELELSEIGTAHADLDNDARAAAARGAIAENLQSLRTQLETLRHGKVASFDAVRRYFDDTFFHIDKRTLLVVERAAARVRGISDWLDALAMNRVTKDMRV